MKTPNTYAAIFRAIADGRGWLGMTQILNSIVMIATGEYSDYCTTPYKVLKPFTFREAHALFIATVPKDHWGANGPDAFNGWLVEQGYIEDFPCHEMHLGSYGEVNIECEMADVLFEPENLEGKE